jgi:hypothetical protein
MYITGTKNFVVICGLQQTTVFKQKVWFTICNFCIDMPQQFEYGLPFKPQNFTEHLMILQYNTCLWKFLVIKGVPNDL